jgi:hypothetical protein
MLGEWLRKLQSCSFIGGTSVRKERQHRLIAELLLDINIKGFVFKWRHSVAHLSYLVADFAGASLWFWARSMHMQSSEVIQQLYICLCWAVQL